MKKNKVFSAVALCALLLQTGCYTNLYVNFGNGTGQKISVKDTQTGKEVQVARRKGVLLTQRLARHSRPSLPRKLRLQYPGAIYHLMNRGNHRAKPQYRISTSASFFLRVLRDLGVRFFRDSLV